MDQTTAKLKSLYLYSFQGFQQLQLFQHVKSFIEMRAMHERSNKFMY